MSEVQLCITYQVVWACLWVLGSLTCAGCARGAECAVPRCRLRRNAAEVEESGEAGCSAAAGGQGCVGERGWWCRFVSPQVLEPRADAHGNRSLYLWRREEEFERGHNLNLLAELLVMFSPGRAVSFGTNFRGLHQQLWRVRGGSHGGAQKDVLMLGQVLGWGLLGCPGTVKQLPLQKRQVCLQKERRRVMLRFSKMAGSDSFGKKTLGLLPAPIIRL